MRYLDEETMGMVVDVLENPRKGSRYKGLKEALIERFTELQEKRLRKLMSGLGYKKPSALLREMRNLAGTSASKKILQTLWTQRLLLRVQEVLSVFDSSDLEKLAECADKIMESSANPMIAVASTTLSSITSTATIQENPIQRLTQQISELTTQVDVLTEVTVKVIGEVEYDGDPEAGAVLGTTKTLANTLCVSITTGGWRRDHSIKT
ncbi:uncharacterized protein LOC128896820 [Hylaeus anthracinus]|uniref:uncharacterized protein LOC128896820 n=1 Tax=Hylaeus anthracinus TaxID=313031 RepID=UPI0023B9EA86|nr:uncharacterized protein LOC128896820 [Hylaeus anthracinus]